MATYVAFLRGINVGGKNKLPMKDLRAIFEELGVQQVQTYIQSGNVLFESTAARARTMSQEVHGAVLERTRVESPVIIRSADQLKKLVAAHPLGDAEAAPSRFAAALLASKPAAARVRELEVNRFLPDRWQVAANNVYLHYPEGMARTKLTTVYLDRTLETVSTVRNWNTLNRLVRLAGLS